MTGSTPDDAWSDLADGFVDRHYGSLRGRVRTHVVHQHLRAHLAPPPLEIVDVGGGAGHQSLPLAREGYDVTIVDPSPAMLERANRLIAAEDEHVRARLRLVEAAGEDAPAAVGGRRFGGVLCHGVLMYLDDPEPVVGALCSLAASGAIVSVVAKNVEVLAARPALEGDWDGALAAFGATRQVNGLGVDTRADDVGQLSALLSQRDVDPMAWYGVRLFTDGWAPEDRADQDEDVVLAVELEASRRDPFRRMSRLFHLLGRRR